MQTKTLSRSLGTVLTLSAPAAFAHTGAGDASSLMHGLAHPFLGADHVLAMIAVGLWAAQREGRSVWMAPAVFIAVMTISAALASHGASIPLLEFGVAGSVLAFGALMLAGHRISTGAGLALIAAFAVFHGQAHGSEVPLNLSALGYGIGFVLSTAVLNVGGLISGLVIRTMTAERAWRFAGWAMAGSGAYLLGTI